ncbi:MAG: TolC family protein [Pyrinomonadaceae bacterium]
MNNLPVKHKIRTALLPLVFVLSFVAAAFGQIVINPNPEVVVPKQIEPRKSFDYERFLNRELGLTDDEAVKIALAANADLQATRKDLEGSKALIEQAGYRANPRLTANGSINPANAGMYSAGASVLLPLELGGRRSARVAVAQEEYELKSADLQNNERLLAFEVRSKYANALAAIEKLKIVEESLENAEQGYKLISGRVSDGNAAPLDQNIALVELNRIRAIKERTVASVEIQLLELENVIGVSIAKPLKLKGELLTQPHGSRDVSALTELALVRRPDLATLRITRDLALAKLNQAKIEGKTDAGISLGYQRSTRMMPMLSNGEPEEIFMRNERDNMIMFGVDVALPLNNKNRGNIEAATVAIQAAENRIKFGELTVRREVASAFIRYEAAQKAVLIYRAGVTAEARRNLETIWKTFEYGDRNLGDYVEAEREFLKIEEGRIDAELEVYMASLELEKTLSSSELTGN